MLSKRVKTDNVHVATHPVVQHKLAQLRKADTGPKQFRELVSELTLFLGMEATADIKLMEDGAETLASRVSLVPIMRGGLGLVDAMLNIVPEATVHHIGMYNNPESLLPVLYYNKLPMQCNSDFVLVLDVQIGSGATLIATVDIVKEWIGPERMPHVKIKVVSLVAGSAGLEAFFKVHGDVQVHVAAVDESASDTGLPLPGFGDPGNRMFNAD